MRLTIAALAAAAALLTAGCHVNGWNCPGTIASCQAAR